MSGISLQIHGVSDVRLKNTYTANGNQHVMEITKSDHDGRVTKISITLYGSGATELSKLQRADDFREVTPGVEDDEIFT